MSFNFLDQAYVPEDSYSRQLDRRVAMDEHPYGYIEGDMAAGHVNQGLINERYPDEAMNPQRLPWNYERHAETPPIPRGDAMQGDFPNSESNLRYQMPNRKYIK